ncbi:hypothetical protein M011DRAFT_456850 [Sporormia fimetaria CBS 119925]|uniref:INSIG domain-containing protein n=1 Tax=Sporormia fimetaria CBS 119925 TaxID=1340428 RepID=A0A6A6VJR7_9PLEO|nr:hypothetical protein M011DRAFT_456850 [Sporormia fimetaria CBS 119925]
MDSDSDDTSTPAQPASPQHFSYPHIHRPIPRRNFSNTLSNLDMQDAETEGFGASPPPPTTENGSHGSSSDFLAQLNAKLLRTKNAASHTSIYDAEHDDFTTSEPPQPSKSFLNMRSTLFGIYDVVAGDTASSSSNSIPSTPPQGATTPGLSSDGVYESYNDAGYGNPDGGLSLTVGKRRPGGGGGGGGGGGRTTSQHDIRRPLLQTRGSSQIWPRRRQKKYGVRSYALVVLKATALFAFGTVYGVIVSHLHDGSKQLSAVHVGGVDRKSWGYQAGWGLAGLCLGVLLPYVDLATDTAARSGGVEKIRGGDKKEEAEVSVGERLNEMLRSVVAFLGIAFAIRRCPWESTLQLTLTLALVNPALWYILDRTRNGGLFALISTSILTSIIFLSNPEVLPSPALSAANANATSSLSSSSKVDTSVGEKRFAGVIGYEHLATATWVGSVIFCSCVCFGGIGRRLAVFGERG